MALHKLYGRPCKCVAVQSFVESHYVSWASKTSWWPRTDGGRPRLPETWDSTLQLGAQSFVGACGRRWPVVDVRRGGVWICLDAQFSWAYVDERGYVCGRPVSRCLGRPLRTRVVAHYRGACWMSMCPTMDAHNTLMLGAQVPWAWTQKMGTSTFACPCPEPWERPFLRLLAH